MLEQYIQQQFIDSADLQYQLAQEMGGGIANAVHVLLACVTNGNKILCCGNGLAVAQAAQFAAICVGGLSRERPELAALALDTGILACTQQGVNLSPDLAPWALARQVRVLGQMGDVLLVISVDGDDASLLYAVQAAHEREMSVLALTGRTGGALAGNLIETDVLLCVPHDAAARVREVHQLVLHCLADGIDVQLLGEEE